MILVLYYKNSSNKGSVADTKKGRGESENENMNKIKFNYDIVLLGNVRALCPGCRQAPQSCAFLAGGSSVEVAVEVEVVVVVVAEAAVVPVGRGVEELGGGTGDGEREEDKSSGGADGRGHVTSLKLSGQNSLILSCRYHCRLLERPAGDISLGDHDLTSRIELFTSVDPALSFTKTKAGCAASNRRWWSS